MQSVMMNFRPRTPIDLTVSVDQASLYNLFTAAGSPTSAVDVTVTIAAGVVLRQGLTTGSGWPAGSTLKLINHGTVAGAGGFGARGADATPTSFSGGAAGAGGDAIAMLYDLEIDNTDGNIFGGGGGGGAGGSCSNNSPIFPSDSTAAGGGGGGGGRGYNNASGGAGGDSALGAPPQPQAGHDGNAGSSAAAGTGGAGGSTGFWGTGGKGGDGGDWGKPGANGSNELGGTYSSGIGFGAAAGAAIRKNGHALTFPGSSGNNATQVKGNVA